MKDDSFSWGLLGRPPQWVLDGDAQTMMAYRKILKEADKVKKMSGRQKAIALAELKARFRQRFPEEQSKARTDFDE